MTPLYQMYVNAKPAANWTDFQIACQCVEASINALSMANAHGSITLERGILGPIQSVPHNGTRTLIACNIGPAGAYDMAICNVRYEDNQYIEVIEG
jgi:hypothetical protein